MSHSTLRLLGGFEAGTPTGPARLGRKAKAVLACAALHGDAGVTRARLVSLLWPDVSDADARSAFRQCLHLLRRSLGPGAGDIGSEGDRLVLRDSEWVIDVRQFEALAACPDVGSMLRAAELHRGDFAESLAAGDEFDRWAQAERERLRDLAHALATRLSESATSAVVCEATVRLARRLLASDPVHEGCYRALMRVHARAGLRGKALQLWNECREVLRHELDVEPSPQTAAVIADLRDDAAPPTAGHTPVSLDRHDDPVVLDLMLRGWQQYALFTPESNLRAREAYLEALGHAPGHAEALARVGWTYWIESISGWSEDAEHSFACASDFAARAVACSWHVPAAHAIQGKVLLWSQQYDAALQQMRRAVELAPQSPYSHFNLGDAQSWCGLCEEALASIDRAMALDANDHGIFLTIRGFAHWMQRDYRQARTALESAATRNPTYVWAYGILTGVHGESGELDAARQMAARARSLNRRMSLDFASRVMPFRNADHRRRFVAACRAAGVPEHEGAHSTSPAKAPTITFLRPQGADHGFLQQDP